MLNFWFYYSMIRTFFFHFHFHFHWSDFRVFQLHYGVIRKVQGQLSRPLTHFFLCSVSSLPALWVLLLLFLFLSISLMNIVYSVILIHFLVLPEGYMESLNYCRGNKTNIVWSKNVYIASVTNIYTKPWFESFFYIQIFLNLLKYIRS